MECRWRESTLLSSLKDESYIPNNPAKRVHIPKKTENSTRHTLATEDKLVQEVARMILEAIYMRDTLRIIHMASDHLRKPPHRTEQFSKTVHG